MASKEGMILEDLMILKDPKRGYTRILIKENESIVAKEDTTTIIDMIEVTEDKEVIEAIIMNGQIGTKTTEIKRDKDTTEGIETKEQRDMI